MTSGFRIENPRAKQSNFPPHVKHYANLQEKKLNEIYIYTHL